MHLGRWAAPAALLAAFALAACSGGGMTPTAGGTGMTPVAGAQHLSADHLTIVGVHSNATCNTSKFPGGCFTYSDANGLIIDWCYGPPSDPCADTSQITNWSGNVTKVKTGKKVGAIKVKWSGPFACGSMCTGEYEQDAMTPKAGKTPPKQTQRYVDEQIVSGCLGTACGVLTTIGINIGP